MKEQVSIRLSEDLVAWVDAQAKSQNRTRANFIEMVLKEKRDSIEQEVGRRG